MYRFLAVILIITGSGATTVEAAEFCHETKCWQYESVSDVRVGGMDLEDGTYIRADHTEREINGEKIKAKRIVTMTYSGDTVAVDIFSYEETSSGNKTEFSFGYSLADNQLIEEKTEIREENKIKKSRISDSIPQIADDLLKNRGVFTSGEAIEYSQTIRLRGDRMKADHVLTVLGKIRYQGEELILLRSEYTFGLASVTGNASGYLMQDAVTSMPRRSAHIVTINVADEVITMKTKGYVSVLAR